MVKGIFMIFILCLVLFLCFDSYAFNLMENKHEGETAPDFTLEDLSRKEISLSDYEGKSVILFFWTTWCPHCRRTLIIFNTEYKNMQALDIELLAINIKESKELVENYIKRYSIDFPMLLDFDAMLASTYGIVGVPTIILVSKEGKIVSVSNSLPNNYKELLSK